MKLKETEAISRIPRIGIAAHYTGYTWYKNKLSHEIFATWLGRICYHSMKPWMVLGRKVMGIADLEIVLLQRHYLINRLLENAIEEMGVRQVIELACGLSPRGFRLVERYRLQGLLYIETDLPAMAYHKKKLLTKAVLSREKHKIVPCDVLAESGPNSLRDYGPLSQTATSNSHNNRRAHQLF
jgi:O-methyltransferase involved in polyketide biosynthesis